MTEQTEKELLQEQAVKLGVSFSPNIGIETLKQRIKAKLEEKEAPAPESQPELISKSKTEAERQQAVRQKQWKDELNLVRIRVSCLNPLKAQVPGEILTVANKYVGTVRKYVPFGEATNNGYHVPKIIYNELKSRKFNSVTTRKGENGQMVVTQRLVPEFAIEVLPPLSKEELQQLARQQAAAAGQ